MMTRLSVRGYAGVLQLVSQDLIAAGVKSEVKQRLSPC